MIINTYVSTPLMGSLRDNETIIQIEHYMVKNSNW